MKRTTTTTTQTTQGMKTTNFFIYFTSIKNRGKKFVLIILYFLIKKVT
jgi:hypothetical protein